MIRRTPAVAIVSVLGIGVLALSACAPTVDPDATPTTDPDALALTGWTEVDPSQLQDGGTLNLAALSSPTDVGNWNSGTAEGYENDALNIEAPTTGGLIKIETDGSWEADPNYAESVELISEDPQIVEVKLNPDAVWEDGTPITSADYQDTFQVFSGEDPDFNLVSTAGYEEVSDFTVVDDTTFQVTFGTIYADWPSIFGAPYPSDITSDAEAWNTKYVETPLPSIGPYVYTSVDNSAKVYTATKNPNWWGEEPKLDTITFTVIDQEAQAQAFANDEIDAVETSTVDAYLAAQEKDGSEVLRSGGLTWSQVTFNGTAAPLDDVEVRKAIAHGIDREIIGRAANEPLGAPAAPTGNWIFMPGQAGYEDTAGEQLAYDPELAMSILEDAGWTHGDGEWTKDGKKLKLSVIVPQGTASNELRAQQIQASLAEIDIQVTIDSVPGAKYFANIFDGKYEMATFGWGGTAFPISSAESLFYPAQEPGDQSGQNLAFVTDESLGDLWDQANSELDPDARLEITSQINDVIASYVPMLPIYAYPNVYVVDGELANYGPATFEAIDYTKVGFLAE